MSGFVAVLVLVIAPIESGVEDNLQIARGDVGFWLIWLYDRRVGNSLSWIVRFGEGRMVCGQGEFLHIPLTRTHDNEERT